MIMLSPKYTELKLHALLFVYQFLSICKTQTDLVLTSPDRTSKNLNTAGLLRVNQSINAQEGEMATQESTGLFDLPLTCGVRNLAAFYTLIFFSAVTVHLPAVRRRRTN